jgi:hypothetical protein
MLRKKRDIVVGIAVPWSLYQHLQGAFAQAWARMCVDMDDGNRIFHPGDPFINVLRWLCRGIKDGETDGPAPAPVSGESFACGLLADFFVTVNGILEDQEPPAAPMTIEEMITGLRVAGLDHYLGPDGWQRICAMIREDIPERTGYTAEGRIASEMVPRQEPPAGTWGAQVPVTYSGKPGDEDSQVTITEPGDVRRVFTHYPEHPDDPDHRELTWGYTGSGPLATGALILNDALGFGTPGTIDKAGVMPGGIPSPMLRAFMKDVVAEFPQQAGWQLTRAAVLEWVDAWRASNYSRSED